MNTPSLGRVNLTLPQHLIDEARKRGSISKVTANALTEVFARDRRLKAMEELSKLPPANPEIKDAAKYIHDMRRGDMQKRDKKLGLL